MDFAMLPWPLLHRPGWRRSGQQFVEGLALNIARHNSPPLSRSVTPAMSVASASGVPTGAAPEDDEETTTIGEFRRGHPHQPPADIGLASVIVHPRQPARLAAGRM